MFSVAFVVLFSIPAASQQVDVVESAGDGMEAVIDTRFSDTFSLEMRPGMEKMKLEDSASRFRLKERPSMRRKKIVTPVGSLVVRRSNDSVLKKVETPYGTLRTGVRDGRRFSSFSGLNRSRVEITLQDLESRMSMRSREARAKRRSVLDRMMPEMEISSNYTSDVLNVTNTGEEAVSLSGWRVVNSGESESPYPLQLGSRLGSDETTLEPGETVSLQATVDSDKEHVLKNEWGRKVAITG